MTPNDPAMTLLKPHLVVPLYIYPSPGAWEPLFQAARDSPSVSFIVVVNPCNGPGVEALPDSNYRNVLAQLSTFPNIQVLGYVYCSYGTRPIADVQKDISIYSGWNLQFKMNGIFFDEVPSTEGDLDLMTSLAHFSRSIWNQSTGQSGILVYNPGVAVGEGFYRGVDLVVAFEQSEHQWQSWYLHQDNPIHLRNKNVAIVHSCSGDAKVLAREMVKMRLGGLYLTEQSGGGVVLRELEAVVVLLTHIWAGYIQPSLAWPAIERFAEVSLMEIFLVTTPILIRTSTEVANNLLAKLLERSKGRSIVIIEIQVKDFNVRLNLGVGMDLNRLEKNDLP
ncbi:hypothetical protein HG530_009153 [Fusarium avenaceum]|nr:hypothetical protein HG530_009153 [Fusarium avenaceum]